MFNEFNGSKKTLVGDLGADFGAGSIASSKSWFHLSKDGRNLGFCGRYWKAVPVALRGDQMGFINSNDCGREVSWRNIVFVFPFENELFGQLKLS